MSSKDTPFNHPAVIRRRRRWGYLGRMLLEDEYIVHVARLHWVIYVSSLIGMVCGILLLKFGTFPAAYFMGPDVAGRVDFPMKVIALFCIGVSVLYLFFISLRFVSTELVVTNERFIYKRGLMAPSVVQATITKISSVDIQQTMFGNLLDYGDITVRSSGQDIPMVDHVADPFSLYYHVMHAARVEVRPELEKTPQTIELESRPANKAGAKALSSASGKIAPPKAQAGNLRSATREEDHEGDGDDDDDAADE